MLHVEDEAVSLLPALTRTDCSHTPFYCEENVYKLCQLLEDAKLRSTVVFVSNADRKVPLWRQRAGKDDQDGLVVWDYHVFLVVTSTPSEHQVFDLDSRLSFPAPFADYAKETLRYDDDSLLPEFRRRFRLVPAVEYLDRFSSDRSHMRDEESGRWVKPPPPHSPIAAEEKERAVDLQDFISMDEKVGIGAVVGQKRFFETFAAPVR